MNNNANRSDAADVMITDLTTKNDHNYLLTACIKSHALPGEF